MNNEIKTFAFEGRTVRTVQDDQGNPLWVAKDVVEALGYTWNGNAAIRHVPEEWRGVRSVLTPSAAQQMAVVTEQGLYFFLGRSDKSAALPFQKWIAGEVLPSIRKTGSYQAPGHQPEPAQTDLFDAWTPERMDHTASLLLEKARLLRSLANVERGIRGTPHLSATTPLGEPRKATIGGMDKFEYLMRGSLERAEVVEMGTLFNHLLTPAGFERNRANEMRAAKILGSELFKRRHRHHKGERKWVYERVRHGA